MAPNWAVSVDYIRLSGYDLLVTWDTNAPPYFALGPGQTRTAAQANLLRPLGVPNRTGGPYGIPFTGFRSLYLQFNGGRTEYNAMKLALNKRMSYRYLSGARATPTHVSGTCETAAENRVAHCAKRSSAGVRPRVDPYDPSRSARSVSIVIRMIGRPGGNASGACTVPCIRAVDAPVATSIAVSIVLRSSTKNRSPGAGRRSRVSGVTLGDGS
jgi:hypothetical protein